MHFYTLTHIKSQMKITQKRDCALLLYYTLIATAAIAVTGDKVGFTIGTELMMIEVSADSQICLHRAVYSVILLGTTKYKLGNVRHAYIQNRCACKIFFQSLLSTIIL